MKRLLKWFSALLAVVVLATATVFSLAWWSSERVMNQRIVVDDPPLPPIDADGIEHGRHLFRSRGCSDCHGERGVGRVVIDVPPMRMVSSNLTPAGAGRHYDTDAFGRAIRHGVRHDGTPLKLMPIIDYAELSDADTAALAGYLGTLQPVTNDPGKTEIRLLGRLLHLFGKLELVPGASIDHSPRRRTAPAAAVTREFGAYVANTCKGCHGTDFRGQRVHGTPPDFPPASDLTALDGWQSADLVRVLREGIRPDGRALHPLMPWQAFRTLTDDEINAMWLYFESL
jgi:mono/diheme cytochrome c family protein